jgi:predicted HD superfamily hydrolase involved in NAD metabolism
MTTAIPDYYPQLNLSRQELLKKVAANMSDFRFQHVLGVETAAIELAERFGGVDPQLAGLAGLLHDYAKEVSDETYLEMIDRLGLEPSLKNWGNNVWHGMVGAYLVQEAFPGIEPAIIEAIRVHTVGKANMNTLEKIVYVADYIEHNRTFPGVDQARQVARESLDGAVSYETIETVKHLASKAVPIYPQTLETYNAYVKDYPKTNG